jgi:hypothetical protein
VSAEESTKLQSERGILDRDRLVATPQKMNKPKHTQNHCQWRLDCSP